MTAGDWRQSPVGNGDGRALAPPPGPATTVPAAAVLATPVPMRFTTGQAAGPGGKPVCVLQVDSATGTFLAFLDPVAARSVAAGLQRVADAGDLWLAPPGPPGGP